MEDAACKEVLRRYSDGIISRYEAMEALGMEEMAELEAALSAHQMPFYEPDEERTQEKLSRLRLWLDRGTPS